MDRLKEFITQHGGPLDAAVDAWVVQATNSWNHENWSMPERRKTILKDVEWGLEQAWPTSSHKILSDFELQIGNASHVPLGVPPSTPPP